MAAAKISFLKKVVFMYYNGLGTQAVLLTRCRLDGRILPVLVILTNESDTLTVLK